MRALVYPIGLALAAVGTGGPTRPAPAAPAPVVLELFTSQGCSSCPPADALAGRLARSPGLVVISRPVTYWDRLGWKDTLGRTANTELQRFYAGQGHAGAGVYTPQMVVNGGDAAVGSDEPAIAALVRRARAGERPRLALARGPGGLVAGVAGPASGDAYLELVGLVSRVVVAIGSGENGGRRIEYTNVFAGATSLGSWTGGTRTFRLAGSMGSIKGADRHAILLRRRSDSVILAGLLVESANGG